MPAPVLIVLHQEQSTPGRVGQALRQRGCALDIRRPRFGDPLPPTLQEHSGAIIFGGPMSVSDQDEFVRREIDWIAVPLKEKKPFLGICLGAQMLAHHLGPGLAITRTATSRSAITRFVRLEVGRAVCADWPENVYQWHREGFDLPCDCALVAEGDVFPVQAFRSQWRGVRAAVPSGRDPRHDVPLDHARA